MSRLRVAVVGCGGRGRGPRGHLAYLKTLEDVEIAAVCDVSESARDAAGDQYGVARRYATVEELLDAERLDAVFITPTAHLNAQLALPCLERGVNTLLEKPPGMTATETKQLRDAAVRTGAKAMVGWNRRFHPIITQARKMVEERGPVVQIVGEFHQNMESGPLPEVVLERVLLESPIHALDLIVAMAGSEVVEVHSAIRRAFARYNDVHGAQIVFANGCLAHFIANYTTDARLERYEIHGRGISAYLEGVRQGVVVFDGERHELTRSGSSGTLEQDRYFLDCVKYDTPVSLPAANLDEAVKTMEVADAILSGPSL